MMDTLTPFFDGACTSKTKPERLAKAAEFAAAAVKLGLPAVFEQFKLLAKLGEAMSSSGKKDGPKREGAVYIINELTKSAPFAQYLLIPVLSNVMELEGDKLKPVKEAAVEASTAIFKGLDENLAGVVLPELLKVVHSGPGNGSRLAKVCDLSVVAPQQMANRLAEAIPAVTPYVNDILKEVSEGSRAAIKAMCETCPNPDMEPFLPELEICLKDREQIEETVFKMASSTFVAEVDGSTLSILCPVLEKGLSTASKTHVKRQCSRIIENMVKLVDEPRYLETFIPKILPLLESAKQNVSDPECRDVCEKAATRLAAKAAKSTPLAFDIVKAKEVVAAEAAARLSAVAGKAEFAYLFELVANACAMLNEVDDFKVESWNKSAGGLLVKVAGVAQADADAFSQAIREIAEKSRIVVVEDEVVEDAEVLCDLPFGLAYGNKVLLRKTHLKLHRGHKYGLLGQNDCGKTSLLNALADYKIDGFPTADICRTVFVATDIKTELADLTVLEYMYNDPLLRDCGVEKDAMEKMLNSVGFKEGAPANTTQKVGTLSGGWRMKLALSRAILLKADILLLDEPTNHLDAYNVKWVETYLQSLTDVTCIMVSHDSGLLTRVCNKIIEIDELKLHYFNGNLEAFVEKKPEAKCYFELAKEGKIDFHFPNPGPLPGINSKGKAILKMDRITFTYPGVAKPQLNNVSVQVSLSSRVACVGENGAGKSTMIKLLTGELEPDEGSGAVWKHPNCRVGYIAQHAFHHIEKHLDETANDYIRWRYANGGDREEAVKVTSIATAEEIKMMEAPIEIPFLQDDGSYKKIKKTIERLTEKRRDVKVPKKSQEYECQFVGSDMKGWVDRELLMKNGWEKLLKLLDEKIALRATQFARPLTKDNVQKHLADVGLAPEFSTHMRIGALSGGQKVKVVLASALWQQPHILILDEPTNYLDRESLGALARAIRKFEGGVVMITHNSQFCDNLCPVVWHLQNNTLDVKGDAEWMAEAARAAIVVDKIDESDMVDRFGNTVELVKKKVYSKKELKQKKLRRLKRFKETGEDYDSDEDEE
jgi:elongation factor 3